MLRHPNRPPLAIFLIAGFAMGQDPLQGTLSRAAARAGLAIGIAASSNQLTGSFGETAKTHFNLIVSEHELKFLSVQPTRGQFRYAGGDSIHGWGNANGLRLRGHTFIWPSQSGWVSNSSVGREGMLGIMEAHIDSVGGHFRGKASEWNVVNEIMSDAGSGGNNALRSSVWRLAIGDDFADSAFVYARRADPHAKLFYNEYGGDTVNSKSDAMLNLARKWVRNGIPVDGIGLECHLYSPVDKQAISDNIRRFGELGLRVSLSEVDIRNGTAEDWVNVMAACLENFNCTSFVTWGLHDGTSWLGSNCGGCLLFADATRPKPAVQALIDLMNGADPDIAARRKDFARDPVVPILALPRESPARSSRAGSVFSAAGVPMLFGAAVPVDPLGRERTVGQRTPGAAGRSVTNP